MKFIRDIIGEKRQMTQKANGASGANGSTGLLADEFLNQSGPAPEAAMPQAQPRVDEKAVEDAAPSAPQIDALTPPQSNADDVTGSLAGFFAQDEKSIRDAEALIDQMEDDDAPTVSIKPRMSVLELGKSDEYVGETETDNDAGASEPSTEHAAAPEATAELVDDTADAPDQADLSVSEADPVSEQPVAATRHTANTARPPEETASESAEQDEPDEQDMSAPEQDVAPAKPTLAEAAPAEPAPVHPQPRNYAHFVDMPVDDPTEEPTASAMQPVDVPQPAMGRGASRQGRVKTRLLGFNINNDVESDPIAGREQATAAPFTTFPVGWLIITDGPGRGSAFTLFNGVSNIGRDKDQTVPLDFGDNSISRENHAAIAYDPAQKSFYIGHGGKANLVRRNDRPVLSTEELSAGDHINIGETTLRFVPLCGSDFTWDAPEESGLAHASNE